MAVASKPQSLPASLSCYCGAKADLLRYSTLLFFFFFFLNWDSVLANYTEK